MDFNKLDDCDCKDISTRILSINDEKDKIFGILGNLIFEKDNLKNQYYFTQEDVGKEFKYKINNYKQPDTDKKVYDERAELVLKSFEWKRKDEQREEVYDIIIGEPTVADARASLR